MLLEKLLGMLKDSCFRGFDRSSESSLYIHCSMLSFSPGCDENKLRFIKCLKRHHGKKRKKLYELDGGNNKVGIEPEIGEGNSV